jgi:carbon storage regulator CsrA
MLVLTRKHQERIHVGDNITVTVVRIKGNTVRIGIEAPQDVRVMRGEIAHQNPETRSIELDLGQPLDANAAGDEIPSAIDGDQSAEEPQEWLPRERSSYAPLLRLVPTAAL